MITPRPYLSYSQKNLWKQNPDRYVDLYLYDGRKLDTKETRFGHEVAEALERDELIGEPVIDLVMARLPKFELMDVPVDVELVVGKEKIPLHGRMDSRREDFLGFKEYKTGKYDSKGRPAWTQAKVDADKQITFYATMCYLITKKVPEDIELDWIVTENSPHNEGEIIATGDIHRFHTRRDMGAIINEMADIRKVWAEIIARCELELLA